jgi:hypothetical protein
MLRGAIAAAVTPLADGGAPLRGLIDPERSIALEAARTVGALGS